ncbi:MAG TPA: hypothetical protein VEB63_02525 [Chitinophagaceae bacterium]|nr:hypothetical protein [Chitinophagaceae bacterium]
MKGNAPRTVYFSAYPLKAVQQQTEKNSSTQTPYLRAILSDRPATARVRVMPMIDPFTRVIDRSTPRVGKLPGDVEQSEKGWFNNYE